MWTFKGERAQGPSGVGGQVGMWTRAQGTQRYGGECRVDSVGWGPVGGGTSTHKGQWWVGTRVLLVVGGDTCIVSGGWGPVYCIVSGGWGTVHC